MSEKTEVRTPIRTLVKIRRIHKNGGCESYCSSSQYTALLKDFLHAIGKRLEEDTGDYR